MVLFRFTAILFERDPCVQDSAVLEKMNTHLQLRRKPERIPYVRFVKDLTFSKSLADRAFQHSESDAECLASEPS